MSVSKLVQGKYALLALLSLCVAPSAFAYGGWAVIVVNPQTGSWGSYHGAVTRAEAEADAMAECGANCSGVSTDQLEARQSNLIETYVLNGWIAYASSANGVPGTSGVHDSRGDAESSAVQNCVAKGGQSCYVKRSVASYVNYPDENGSDNQ